MIKTICCGLNTYFCSEKAEGLHGRVLARSNNNGNANAGVAYANANNASSNSNTNYGSRLANNRKGWASAHETIASTAYSHGMGNSRERETRASATAALSRKAEKSRVAVLKPRIQAEVGRLILEHLGLGKLKDRKE